MSPNENKAVAGRFFEEVWNARRLDELDAYIAPEALHWGDDCPVPDFREHFRQHVFPEVTTAFPDAHFTVEEVIANREWVAVRVVLRGTHQGALPGIPPTGRRVAVLAQLGVTVRTGEVPA